MAGWRRAGAEAFDHACSMRWRACDGGARRIPSREEALWTRLT
jgi:hypothetical protein